MSKRKHGSVKRHPACGRDYEPCAVGERCPDWDAEFDGATCNERGFRVKASVGRKVQA